MDEHITPGDAKSQEPEAEHDEPVAPTEGKKKINKKNKNMTPGRPHREQQDLAEAAAVPGNNVEEEDAGATTLQEPMQKQQLLATSAPPDVQGATSAAAEASTIKNADGETPTPLLALPNQNHDDDEKEEETRRTKTAMQRRRCCRRRPFCWRAPAAC